MKWINTPQTLLDIKKGKESGVNSFIIEFSPDRYPPPEGLFYFSNWCSLDDMILKWLSFEHNIVLLFSAKDNIKFPDIEMERKFKNLMGTQVEFNPEDKYSRLASGIKLFELPRDSVGSCETISKALEQQKLKIAVVIQRAEVLLSNTPIDSKLLDSVKDWITVINNHTLILLTDNKENIHHEIRQMNPSLVRHLEWLPPVKEDFEKLFTTLKIIKPHLFDGVHLHKLASACEGIHYLELEILLDRTEKEKGVLTEELLRKASEDTKKQVAKNKVGDWIISKKPNTTFNDIAGLKNVEELIDCKILPYQHPELAKKYGLRPGGGLLLFGPQGTGKTMLGEAIANKLGVPLFSITGANIIDKYVGESGKFVKKLFLVARQCKPYGLIYIDEIDVLIPRRDSDDSRHMNGAVAQFLAEMDGISTDQKTPILVIGATNRPQDIDPAALRPGRFDNIILVSLPNREARKQIFYLNLRYSFFEHIDYYALADMTEGYSGADIAKICKVAAEMCATQAVTEKQIRPITMDILIDTIHKARPSVSREEMEWFREFECRRGEIFR